MPVNGTLYTYPDNFRAFKALIAAKYSGAAVKVADNFVFGETNKTKQFLTKFPLGKVPAFEDDKGVCLFESNAIAYHVSNDALRGGSDAASRARVQQWMGFADSEVLPAACTWVFPVMGIMQANKQAMDHARDDLTKALKVLNEHLLNNTFLVGERVTLADIAVCCTLLLPFKHVLDQPQRKNFVNVTRWFTTMVNQPEVKSVMGEVSLCSKAPSADHHKGHGHHGDHHRGHGHGHGKDKAKTPKKDAPKKKEEAPAPAEELAMPGAEKSKDPLALLPKGTFDMDDFKRFYSNNDEVKSVPYFFDKFDKEHYSIWRCDYKYNHELTMVFMSCNLIGGMFQRLEKLRKHAFASVCLFGENNNSTISGIWVWRGHDLVFELSEDWQIDYSSYDWKKLDADSDETKKLVDQYFKWEGADLEGRKFNQGKIFK